MRTAIVTGGTGGIGLAVCRQLLADGFHVTALFGGDQEAATRCRDELGIETLQCDVTKMAECALVVEQVQSTVGPVDTLVNNAGICRDAPFHKLSEGDWEKVMATNLDGLFNMTRQIWDGMRERGFGRVINISSINGLKGQFGQANYAAAKAGVIGFTKSLALEGARKGITANVVAPGYIDTPMLSALKPETLAMIADQIPIGRLGRPEDVARCVSFLVSQDASFITGETLNVNGGQYLS